MMLRLLRWRRDVLALLLLLLLLPIHCFLLFQKNLVLQLLQLGRVPSVLWSRCVAAQIFPCRKVNCVSQ